MDKITIRQTSMKNYSKCPKLYYWAFVEGIELKEKSDALKIGVYVDTILSGKNAVVSENDIESIWVAKGRAIIRAMDELKLINTFDNYNKQVRFRLESDKFDLTGTLDFAYTDELTGHFGELKVSGSPEFYLSPWYIGEQIGTYFISNPKYRYVTMYVIQTPELKYNENKEDTQLYELRCYEDILRRPSHYFQGFKVDDKGNNTFGINFSRGEFDLSHLMRKYNWIVDSMIKSMEENFWPDRRSECNNPVRCDYFYACNYGVSEDRYIRKEKK